MAGMATISIKQDRKILFSKARWRANLDVSILGWSGKRLLARAARNVFACLQEFFTLPALLPDA
jgi:hypothetical protein